MERSPGFETMRPDVGRLARLDHDVFHPKRPRAACRQALGLEKNLHFLYHKCHVDKVMAVAVTGFAFDKSVENGGEGVKIGFFRVQGARIAKRQQKASRRDEDGILHYDGPVLRENGDAYMVDVNVTGSDSGTSDAPKFSLSKLFHTQIWPVIQELVGPGGRYEGYLPIPQGDNAGPHQDTTFLNECKQFCAARGYLWEPQAPQMPYMNNLDLIVFPAMSKRHSKLLRSNVRAVVPPNEIWEAAQQVWKDIPSAVIARGFVLAFRIAQLVIDNKGSNKFLCDKRLHQSIRKDFADTDTGITKRVVLVDD